MSLRQRMYDNLKIFEIENISQIYKTLFIALGLLQHLLGNIWIDSNISFLIRESCFYHLHALLKYLYASLDLRKGNSRQI